MQLEFCILGKHADIAVSSGEALKESSRAPILRKSTSEWESGIQPVLLTSSILKHLSRHVGILCCKQVGCGHGVRAKES